jgi:hypothetical protein
MRKAKKTESKSPFVEYGEFVSKLKQLTREPSTEANRAFRVKAALNGEANIELRRVSSLVTRRKFGTFFTGSELSARLVSLCSNLDEGSTLHDPTVGMGDLLLAAASRIRLEKTLLKTLQSWGRQLSGTDLHPEFIEGTKARLVLLAQQRHGSDAFGVTSYAGLFPKIRVADGHRQRTAYNRATHLLLNPPYGYVNAPADCTWAGGRISEAALFVVTSLERAKPGTEMFAILPDVLRSGSFTNHWRQYVNRLASVRAAEPYGVFDETADVDVFLMHAVKRDHAPDGEIDDWPKACGDRSTTKVADLFEVHVGRVVPHRDRKSGPRHPYIHARCVPPWSVMREFTETRRHQGLVYKPPFVTIRRTSRPGHPYRATATVIDSPTSVAVENHLIVCRPIDGKLETCIKLMQELKTEAVNEYLNARIRCRHLTVSAVKTIPILK